ncbi:hypothetical protein [Actinophytocola algeriensis]|uniref:Uncharacterized protein n=1 Tax=Actinophytocola algeriensis TaxID=1768010 RepID=A0A7W7QBV0_9PSEU|nr:hypothetical protein [Actinophytocola algeriensis]MBB4910568.1 hypothetical protein [Actinophytocola algeriensis]MBE1480443.1 hypothetical protein [Actinophytocola algeriensis]
MAALAAVMAWSLTSYTGTDPAATASTAPSPSTQNAPSDGLVIGDETSGKSFPEQNTEIEARLRDQPKGDELYRMAEDGEYLVTTDARSPRLNLPGTVGVNAIDPVTWQECASHFNIDVAPYWFKNKYNICRRSPVTLLFVRRDDHGTVVDSGTVEFQLEFIGTMRSTENVIDFRFRMLNFQTTGWTDPTWLFHIQLPCLNADPARTSDCTTPTGTPSFYEMPVSEWQRRAGEEFGIAKAGTTTAVPAGDKYRAELRGFFAFGLQLTLFTPQGPQSDVTPDEIFRCDIANYISGSRCNFNNVGSVLEFSLSDSTLSQSAEFINDAQTDITRTSPGIPGKKVPGAPGDIPLHRLYKAYDTDNTIQASRRKVPKTCRRYHGPGYTKGGTKQCDEYPLATTYENSVRVDTRTVYDYAVKAIDKDHNEKAGRVYGSWLSADHILDYDPFWVKIVP